jgi:hypothetical protein
MRKNKYQSSDVTILLTRIKYHAIEYILGLSEGTFSHKVLHLF